MSNDQDRVQKYVDEVSKHPLLTPEREKELSHIIQYRTNENECLAARNELVLSNLLLVVNIALKIYKRLSLPRNRYMSVMDLIQLGNMALINCANMFDGNKNTKFNTYAYTSIERKIYQGINENRLIRLPKKHEIIITKISQLENEHGASLTDEIIKQKLNLSNKVLKTVRKNIDSMPIKFDDWELFLDHFEDTNKNTKVSLKNEAIKDLLQQKIKALKPLELKVVNLMFFGSNKTRADVARQMGVSRERVRVILDRALKKLREKIGSDKETSWIGINPNDRRNITHNVKRSSHLKETIEHDRGENGS